MVTPSQLQKVDQRKRGKVLREPVGGEQNALEIVQSSKSELKRTVENECTWVFPNFSLNISAGKQGVKDLGWDPRVYACAHAISLYIGDNSALH